MNKLSVTHYIQNLWILKDQWKWMNKTLHTMHKEITINELTNINELSITYRTQKVSILIVYWILMN